MSYPQRHLPQPATTVLEAVNEAAEMWGADWRREGGGGRLRLPVVQGLRRGVVEGTVRATPEGDGTALEFDLEQASYVMNKSALVVLILGGLGGLSVALWPLSPRILQLAPLGAVLALVAWLMVVSRLRNSDPKDFFDLVADLANHL